jgi:radical SAM protein with 4Fe4S-binding SPASM domain
MKITLDQALSLVMEKIPFLSDGLLRRRISRQFMRGEKSGFLPRQLAIETSAVCNAKCMMCPSQHMKRPKGFMSLDLHRMIIDKIGACCPSISVISHAGQGEPLLDKTICEKLRYEKQAFREAQLTLYTNASLLDDKCSHDLISAGLDRISISLNAYRESTYQAIMALSYKRTMMNVTRFLKANEAAGWPIRVDVSIIPTELHTKEEIEEFQHYWRDKVDTIVMPPWISWGGHFENPHEETQWPCRYIWEVFMVDWNGTVKMCCEDFDSTYPLGNIDAQSPMEIFNSPRMQKQRRAQVKGDFSWPKVCENCIETYDVARQFWLHSELAAQQR